MLYDNKGRTFLKTHFENVFRMLLKPQITLCYFKNILTMLYDNKGRTFLKQHFENVFRMLMMPQITKCFLNNISVM